MFENRTDVALAYQVERATIAMDGGPPLSWSGRPGLLAPHAQAGFQLQACTDHTAAEEDKLQAGGLRRGLRTPDLEEDQSGRFRLSQSFRFVSAEVANAPGECRWRSEDIQSPRHDPI